MRIGIRMLVGAMFVGFTVLLMSAPALGQAGDPPNATGPCQGSASLSNGVVIDPYVSSGVYEIPLKGTATYNGGVTGAVSPPRPISGEVYIEGPFGSKISITDEWTWNNDSSESLSKSGSVDWDLPSWLPRGAELTVTGKHVDQGFVCEGSVTVTLEGGFFDSPLGAVSLIGTALSGAGVVASLFAKATGALTGGAI